MRGASVFGVLLVLSIASGGVAAQTRQAAAPPAEAGAGGADEVARGLFQAGKAAFESGDYTDALNFFEQSHARSGRPQLLFNIGQAADRLRQDEKALAAFRRYLAELPDAQNRVEVEARISALERSKAEREAELAAAAAAAPSATAPTPEETAARASPASTQADGAYTGRDAPEGQPITQQWWFWTGIGAVVVGGAAAALVVALGGEDAQREPFYEGNGGSLQGP